MRTIPLALKSTFAALCIAAATNLMQAQSISTTNDIPHTISYQGKLTNVDGSPLLDGTYRITLSLCANPDGSGRVWQDSYSATVSQGIFNLYLGSGNVPLPDPAIMNTPLWIATQIGDAPLMYPLTPLSASPYALNVSDKSITTGKLADGAVTPDKVQMDYIAGIAVNGRQVTGKGTVLNIEGSKDIALSYNDATGTLHLSKPIAATEGDNEKGATTLAAADVVWSLNGDGWDISSGTAVPPASGDWIGTSSTSGETFEIRTNGEIIMRYQPNGTNTPNVVGGYIDNTISLGSDGSVIAGGGKVYEPNAIEYDANYAVIGGGKADTIFMDYGVIGGGMLNKDSALFATIGGGYTNSVLADFGTIAGGEYNTISISGSQSTIGGGNNNEATGIASTIAGGYDHTASGDYSAVGGGYFNTASAIYSAVGGGRENIASYPYSFIGGGNTNQARNDYAAVGGGVTNLACGKYSFVGAGLLDTAAGDYSVIGGGNVNRAWGIASFIGSGAGNVIDLVSDYSSIVGGDINRIKEEAQYSFIGGGTRNHISGSYSVIGGGDTNVVTSFSSTIGGGIQNRAEAQSSTVTGGENNRALSNAVVGAIGGGRNNTLSNSATVVAGGEYNASSNYASTIGGGAYHIASGSYSTIPGGDHLKAQAYAQTAVGFHNAPRGVLPAQPPTTAARKTLNDPLFMVGNGVPATPGGATVASNAFEVSYNGHSVVYDVNGTSWTVTPGNRPVMRGGTYIDNILYAWGDVNANGTINGTSDFGIANITHVIGSGVYLIEIKVVDPQNPATTVFINNAAIVATLVNDNPEDFNCQGSITVSRMIPNTNKFKVCTGTTAGGACHLADLPFMFHLTGRP